MAEEKKYTRKRCEHGKYSFQCKDLKYCNMTVLVRVSSNSKQRLGAHRFYCRKKSIRRLDTGPYR